MLSLIQVMSWLGSLLFCLGVHWSWLAIILSDGWKRPVLLVGLGFCLLMVSFWLSLDLVETKTEADLARDV